ncbi:11a72daa-7430-4ec6-84bf-c98699d6a118 [Thermothielavioides terrestris]|uniref:11a72daa-7430-4ec6-84bf-c98699d6a118 n=1 Tax=Thermothielavioides terrestris TaxID=2587410 RepID=A0A3S5CWB2_9PEZI|nr:11a72daa-7430-4ec6-84bf-c98699d6a118 [Thermothielavioides terrestris]
MDARLPHPECDPTFDKLPWYRAWVLQQVRSQPQRLLLSLPDFNPDGDPNYDHFFLVWNQIQELALMPGPKSINTITDRLHNLGVISTEHNYEAAQSAKELVFSIIGWQTMLYKPDFTPPRAVGGYNILDETPGHRGEARLSLNQFAPSSNKSLPDFLLGFGLMLPPQNYCAFDDADDQALFNQVRVVSVKDINAHVLTKVCGVAIEWVDSLSCHLELDKRTGRLFLFRYPSFCVSCLQQHETRKEGNHSSKSILHRCASEKPGPAPWATEEDVTGLLREILLSYRLIFGQNKRSRAVFRRLQPFARMPTQCHDKFLAQICGRKRFDSPHDAAAVVERDEYDLAADFPHLRSRLARLHGYAAGKKPRSIGQLWRDRRDSTAWLAFWSVLIFGSISVLLAGLQTVFQVLQYMEAKRGS